MSRSTRTTWPTHAIKVLELGPGESYRITNRGVPVGILTPGDRNVLDELTLRVGSQEMTFPDGVRRGEATADVLTELRGAR